MISSNFIRWVLSVSVVAIAIVLFTPKFSDAADLGKAKDYNVFLLGNMTQNNTDSEGKVAVGGNATLSNFFTGMSLSGNSDMLMVGGNLNYNSGTVGQGNQGKIVYGGTAGLSNVSFGSARQENLSSFFSQAQTELTNLSNQLFNLTPTGTAQLQYSTLNLTGVNSGLNVFNISAGDLQSSNTWQFNLPTTATVVVNVTGTSLTWQNGGFNLNGLQRNRILYNLANVTDLTLTSIGVEGSILAPKASVNFNWGQLNGQLIAKNLTGTGQTNLANFSGNLPDPTHSVPTSVPTPALLPGLIGLGVQAWRKRRKA